MVLRIVAFAAVLAAALCPCEAASAPVAVESGVEIDFAGRAGQVKAVNGVCESPTTAGGVKALGRVGIWSKRALPYNKFEFIFGDDLADTKRKGKTAKVEVRVLTDLNGAALPEVKVGGMVLVGGSQKDGITTFAAEDTTFVKGSNMVEIAAPEDMTLYDFSVRVTFR